MHEIAAHVLWVVQADSVDLGQASKVSPSLPFPSAPPRPAPPRPHLPLLTHGGKAMGQDSIIKMVFDAEHVEHDSFTIFGQIMQSAKSFVSTLVILGFVSLHLRISPDAQ
jgi:TBC1 domain family protein 5